MFLATMPIVGPVRPLGAFNWYKMVGKNGNLCNESFALC